MPSLVLVPGIVGDEVRYRSCYQGADSQLGVLKDTCIKITKNEHRVFRAKQFPQCMVQELKDNPSGCHGGSVEEMCWVSWRG